MFHKILRNFAKARRCKLKVKLLNKRYKEHLSNLKLQIQNRKIRVMFLVNDNSKWKTQSLYDLFLKSDKFEPFVVLNIADWQWQHSLEERAKFIETNKVFFKAKGIECLIGYDKNSGELIDLKTFKPDIVFYQQPYLYNKLHEPLRVSKFALTYYIPYYIPNYWIPKLYWWFDFHRFVYKYYQPNEEWAQKLNKYGKNKASKIVGLGHTMLDEFYLRKNLKFEPKYVIYAPHWSIKHPKNHNRENYSTFIHNYKEILEYAKAHPEFEWVFKPHPTLKRTLISTGFMSVDEVEAYYDEWRKLGTCCFDSNYPDLFMNSKLMITDCGSFLVEYFATEKPLVHLISRDCKQKPIHCIQKLFDTFYKVHNIKELYKTLDNLLITGNDYKLNQRQKVMKEQAWLNNYAGKNILDDIIDDIIS